MAASSNRTSQGEPNVDVESQKHELLILGDEIEKLRSEKRQYEDKSVESKNLDIEISEKKKIKESLEIEISSLLSQKETEIKGNQGAIIEKSEELKKLDEELEYKQSLKLSMNNDLESFKTELLKLEDLRKNKSIEVQANSDEIDRMISEKKKEADGLIQTINSLKGDIVILTAKKDSLTDSINTLTESEKQKRVALAQIQMDIEDAMKQLDGINKEAQDKVIEMQKFEEDKKKEYADREAIIVSKEGAVSDEKNWLMMKQNNLKSIRQELEVFHGKKIPNINFE